MTRQIHVLGIGGSLAARSTSRVALELALEGARRKGASTRLIDLRALNLPFYDPDSTTVPASAEDLALAVRRADALIWSTPLYHGSLSGVFKNALDWLELLSEDERPYLSGKAVGLISTAGGGHALQAINQMENIVRALRGYTVPFVVPVSGAWKQLDGEAGEVAPVLARQLSRLGEDVVWAALRLSAEPCADLSSPAPAGRA